MTARTNCAVTASLRGNPFTRSILSRSPAQRHAIFPRISRFSVSQQVDLLSPPLPAKNVSLFVVSLVDLQVGILFKQGLVGGALARITAIGCPIAPHFPDLTEAPHFGKSRKRARQVHPRPRSTTTCPRLLAAALKARSASRRNWATFSVLFFQSDRVIAASSPASPSVLISTCAAHQNRAKVRSDMPRAIVATRSVARARFGGRPRRRWSLNTSARTAALRPFCAIGTKC